MLIENVAYAQHPLRFDVKKGLVHGVNQLLAQLSERQEFGLVLTEKDARLLPNDLIVLPNEVEKLLEALVAQGQLLEHVLAIIF